MVGAGARWAWPKDVLAVMVRAGAEWGASVAGIAEVIGSTEDRVRAVLDAAGPSR